MTGPLGRPAHAALSVIAAAVLAISAAGCGAGGSGTAGGSQTSSKAASTPGASGSTASSGPLAMAACMRAHGVPDYPDPTGGQTMMKAGNNGQVTVNGVALKESPSQVTTAMQACQSKMGGGQASGSPNPQMQQAAIAFANCMRAHGIKNFPDPTVHGNAVGFTLPKGTNPNSPTLQKAQAACQSLMPTPGSAPAGAGKG